MHYLGYYLKWHPQSCYYYAVEHGGFQASPERTPGTYSKYNSIDDRIDDFHYYTTFIKFGIGRATYDAAQEIRSRRHHARGGRRAGQALRRRIPGALRRGDLPLSQHPGEGIPGGLARCSSSRSWTAQYFMHLADRFRSPHLWKYEDGEWRLRHAVWQHTPIGKDYLK